MRTFVLFLESMIAAGAKINGNGSSAPTAEGTTVDPTGFGSGLQFTNGAGIDPNGAPIAVGATADPNGAQLADGPSLDPNG